jgi:queuosine precursor transporter
MDEPPTYRRERALLGFLILGGLFIGALVVCNLIATKFTRVDLWFLGFSTPFVLSVGILPYPLTFLLTDVISEIYGRRRADQVVVVGLLASVMVAGVLLIALQFESMQGPEYAGPTTAEFKKVFGMSWLVIAASMTAYLAAQFLDIRLFHFWKRMTNGRHLWLRNNASTICSQLLDTVLVVSVLFAGAWLDGKVSAAKVGGWIVDGWTFKVLCALADTPICYAVVHLYRRYLDLGPMAEASLD